MYFNQGKFTPIGLSFVIVLFLVLYMYVLGTNLSRKVFQAPQNTRDLSRTYSDCSNGLQRRLKDIVTYASFRNIFGDCMDIDVMSRDTFNAVFTSKMFKGVECKPRKIKFLKTPKPKIALASFKGSGNTWTRHLLEQLTGIWTGDVYNDPDLRNVFIGEVLCPTSNKTFIIKSHEWTAKLLSKAPCKKDGIEDYDTTLRRYDSAILILRNPYDALLAAFNRIHGGHTAAPNHTLLVDNTTEWRNYTFARFQRWRNMTEYWLTRFDGRLHIVFYENLRASLPFELYRLSVFLKNPVSYRKLWCTLKSGRGEFKREKPDWFLRSKLYTSDMQRALDEQIDVIESMLRDKEVLHQHYQLK